MSRFGEAVGVLLFPFSHPGPATGPVGILQRDEVVDIQIGGFRDSRPREYSQTTPRSPPGIPFRLCT